LSTDGKRNALKCTETIKIPLFDGALLHTGIPNHPILPTLLKKW
jgi:hypothetical protein